MSEFQTKVLTGFALSDIRWEGSISVCRRSVANKRLLSQKANLFGQLRDWQISRIFGIIIWFQSQTELQWWVFPGSCACYHALQKESIKYQWHRRWHDLWNNTSNQAELRNVKQVPLKMEGIPLSLMFCLSHTLADLRSLYAIWRSLILVAKPRLAKERRYWAVTQSALSPPA